MNIRRLRAILASALLVFGLAGLAILSALHAPFHAASTVVGAVMTSDQDPRNQVPVSNATVTISARLSHGEGQTDASGLFTINLVPGFVTGQTLSILVTHPNYKQFSEDVRVGDAPMLIWIAPVRSRTVLDGTKQTVISDVRIRYTIKQGSDVAVGTVAKTFEAVNTAGKPCLPSKPCSPDGRWAAGVGGITFNAPEDGKFTNFRASCIAGPCPFTRIETTDLANNGRTLIVRARSWSDTATFLVEADTFHTVISDVMRRSFPVVFGPSMSFTLPGTAAGPSIEAELDGQYIVFPLGPALHLSWAGCSSKENPDHSRLYSCELRPGYRFQ